MQGDVLGANPGALPAVGATPSHMEGADDVEEILFKGICSRLILHPGRRIVKDTFLTGAGGAHIPAGVAANARTTTAALGAVQDAVESETPALGYTVTYAVGNTLLIIWGVVIVLLI
mgnify:CR=1 FL=1